jgi:hypothetical protein
MKSFKAFISEAARPRIRIIKARIRNGKVQRRKKVSGINNRESNLFWAIGN